MVDVPGEEVAALLAEPFERFVEARSQRVKALKAEGHKEEAAALAKVRKPARLVWVLDEVARSHPDVAAEAVEAADDVAAAQESGRGKLRPLLSRYREALASLADLASADRSVDAGAVGLALRTVLADPAARHAWAELRLLELPRSEGTGTPLAGPASGGTPRPARQETRRPRGGHLRSVPSGKDTRSEERREREAQALAREAEQARSQAQAALDEAQRLADEASAERADAARAVSDLEEQRAALEAELTEARSRLDATEQAHEQATQRLEEAQDQLDGS